MGRHKSYRLPPFVPLDKRMLLHSPEWRDLGSSAKVLYMQIKAKHTGSNNGQIRLYYSELKGMMADKTISRAFKQLEAKGWICREKIGGEHRWVNDIRLTGKYDATVKDCVWLRQ
ncbi:MAG: hypothetical protein HYT89_02065 [Candidatus Omnitrophica bacterium]|nr:hypothetical protein [Candidatus Omnitrophota bacterium]